MAHSDHSAHLTKTPRVGPIPNSTARPAYHSSRASLALTIGDHWSTHHARSVFFDVSLLGGPVASDTTRTASPGHGGSTPWMGKVCYLFPDREALINRDGSWVSTFPISVILAARTQPSGGDFRESVGRRRRESEVVDLDRTCGVRWWLGSFARPRGTCMTCPRD
jgi:hypothetical protein